MQQPSCNHETRGLKMKVYAGDRGTEKWKEPGLLMVIDTIPGVSPYELSAS